MNRFRDGIYAVDPGASNPVGLALAIYQYSVQMHHQGLSTENVKADPALRLMTHQLMNLMRVENLPLEEFEKLYKSCEKRQNEIPEGERLEEPEYSKDIRDSHVETKEEEANVSS